MFRSSDCCFSITQRSTTHSVQVCIVTLPSVYTLKRCNVVSQLFQAVGGAASSSEQPSHRKCSWTVETMQATYLQIWRWDHQPHNVRDSTCLLLLWLAALWNYANTAPISINSSTDLAKCLRSVLCANPILILSRNLVQAGQWDHKRPQWG